MTTYTPAGIRRIDLHNKNTYQAQIIIDRALRTAYGVYRIRLIHGHHQGQALKNFIRNHYADDPRILRLEFPSAGLTDLVLKELF